MIFSSLFQPRWRVLDFPYPYSGMVAINSDVEWTTWPLQQSLIRIFAGYGLECAFSYWFFAGGGITWKLFDEKKQPEKLFGIATALMRSGVLDTIHSFGGRRHVGGIEFDRKDILNGYQHLEESGVATKIFTNHGCELDTQNIAGDWGTYQQGDVPGSNVYHLDRTLEHGVKFFWNDIDYTVEHPFQKAGFDGDKTLFRIQKCRDGNHVICFKRYLGKLSAGPCAQNLHQQLKAILATSDTGYSIIYQHLGVHRGTDGRARSAEDPILPESCHEQLRQLASQNQNGRLLATTTVRLLNHALLMSVRPWQVQQQKDKLVIQFDRQVRRYNMEFEFGREDLAGWAIRVPSHWQVECLLGKECINLQRTEDRKGIIFHVPWPVLQIGDILENALENF